MKLCNTFVLATLVAPLTFGCAEKVEDAGPKEEELPNIKVELPASPDFDEARAEVKWAGDPDGAYSIFGLRKDIDDRLKEGEAGQKIITASDTEPAIRAWVLEAERISGHNRIFASGPPGTLPSPTNGRTWITMMITPIPDIKPDTTE